MAKIIGIAALIIAIGYTVIPCDCDIAWYGYIDDFFLFIAGYLTFMGSRKKNQKLRPLFYAIAGTSFIIGMLSLIALILFT